MPKTEEDLFDIQLDGIDRDVDTGFGSETYEVTFDCLAPGRTANAMVSVGAETVTTLEIVPTAMSELHRLFAALAEQTKGWLIEKP